MNELEIQSLDFTMTSAELTQAKTKKQHQIWLEMLFKINQNNTPEKDFELLIVESDCFTITDTVTKNELGGGIILLKIILDDVKPSTVIDVQVMKEKLASAAFQKHEYNVQMCTR